MDNSSGATVAAITVTNLSMKPALNGNLAATLLGQSGEVLETLLYTTDANGLISLGKEESKTFTFTFAQMGYAVQAGYYTVDPDSMNADIASMQLSAIAIDFDKDTLDYDLSAMNIGGTILTAAAMNPAAVLSVIDSAGQTVATGTGAVSYALSLPTGKTTGVGVLVEPENSDGSSKTYSLSITNTISGAEGIVINASNGNVAVTDSNSIGFVPATWKYCIEGAWSEEYTWSAPNNFKPSAATYASLYVRAFDVDGRYMDSNTLSESKSDSDKPNGNNKGSTRVTESITPYTEWAEEEDEATPWQNPFADVKASDWFYGDVEYACVNNLMVGTSTDPMLFSPNMTLTRGMVVTVLYRMAESPDASGLSNPFDDVSDGKWYSDAVKWAADNKIVSGYGNGKFGPEDSITREQMAVMIMNYQQFSGNIPLDVIMDREFSDWNKISGWAKDAVNRLTKQGIINGKPNNLFDPDGEATRAEFAAILHRFMEAAKVGAEPHVR